MYAAGRPAHAQYSLNYRFESFAPRSQLKNALKMNFLNVSYWGRTHFVRASIALIVKQRTYSYSLYDFSFYLNLLYLQKFKFYKIILVYLIYASKVFQGVIAAWYQPLLSQHVLVVTFTGMRGLFNRGMVHHPAPRASACGIFYF